jgi:hypothetical protein
MKSKNAALLLGTVLFITAVTAACIIVVPATPSPIPTTSISNPSPSSLKDESTPPVPVKTDLPRESLFLEKLNAIPDYTQTDTAYGGLPGKGTAYCGPTSVSNILMWLAENGFPNLVPHTSDRKKDQFDVIYTLGLPQYMDTGLTGAASAGTSPTEICRGLRQYILDKGYRYKRIECQGWRTVPSDFDTRVKVPNLAWLKQGIQGCGGAWMGIGWYNYDSATDEYKRFDGHWVTLVGYGHDGKAVNLNSLIVHNSGTSASTPKNEYITPERINTGLLKGTMPGLPYSAEGFYKMKSFLKPKTADFAILDYVIVLEMEP